MKFLSLHSYGSPSWVSIRRIPSCRLFSWSFAVAIPWSNGRVLLNSGTIEYIGPRYLVLKLFVRGHCPLIKCANEYWVKKYEDVEKAVCLLKRSMYKVIVRYDFTLRRLL